jgi:aminoglycoside phosphotransferase (APT) family kinase protein
VYISALKEKALYDDLLVKVGGDRAVVDRLIEFERAQRPGAARLVCLQHAIRRWKRENQ